MIFFPQLLLRPAPGVWAVVVALLALSFTSSANDTPQPSDEPTFSALLPLERGRDLASQRVTEFANWLDSFFGDDRIYQESQNSRLKLNLLHISEEGRLPRYDATVQGKLTLPNTQRRVKLLFESSQEDTPNQDASLLDSVDSQDQSLGIRFIKKTKAWWRAHADIGIRFRGGLDTFIRFRLRRLFSAGQWNFRATETVFWFDSTGPGETSRFDVERGISANYLFRSTSKGTWLDETRNIDLSQNFFLLHNISRRRAVAYRIGIIGASKPVTQTTAYIVSARLRQQLHRDWLFFEINPKVVYSRENNFRSSLSLTFKLEVIFGAT
ncbi:MAG: hypothetical protein GXP17_05015 [Gammaproteobacteria bacterium]|nr:hypothetical protein [Gammaproteobacteria bacterium]